MHWPPAPPVKTKDKNMAMYMTPEGEWKVDPPENGVETLRTLCEQHPDWLDLPIGVYTPNGSIDFVGAAGTVYSSEYGGDNEEQSSDYPAGTKILIFSAN
jgi:hypothetical protein